MLESPAPSRGILLRQHNILCFSGCTGNAPPPHTLSTGLRTRPVGASRGRLLTMTYAVVVFSILVQGLTIRGVTARAFARTD